MQNPEKKIEIFNTGTLLFIHFVICSIGLLSVVAYFVQCIVPDIVNPVNIFIHYTDWAVLSSSAGKPAELLQYGLSVPVLAIYYVAIMLFIRRYAADMDDAVKKITFSKVKAESALIAYLGLSLLFNLLFLCLRGRFASIFTFLWLINFFLPLIPVFNRFFPLMEKRNLLWPSMGLFCFLVASLLFVFVPYLSGHMLVSNDYMDIPEKTILSSGTVDNTEFINQHRIAGLHKYDPRISYEKQKFPDGRTNQTPIVNGEMGAEDRGELLDCFRDQSISLEIRESYCQKKASAKNKRIYSGEEIEFVRKNIREMGDQALAGHYFHHQNTMLGTVNEYLLGKPQTQTVFLYGWLNTVLVAKVMALTDQVSFEGYQKVFYSFYPAYYLLLLCAAWIVFKRKSYVLLLGVLSFASLYLIGFEELRFAPGFNPIRHFFDLCVLVFFYGYLFKSRGRLFYFAAAMLFALLGILFSKEFGLALLLSIAVTVIVRAAVERKNIVIECILFVLVLSCSLTLFMLNPTAKNPTLLYVLLGVATPATSWMRIYGLLIVFAAIYVLLVKNKKLGNNWCYLSLLWFSYAQGLLIYYVWNPAPNHFWSLGSVWAMALVLLLRYASENYVWVAANERKILLSSTFLMTCFFLLPASAAYLRDRFSYEKIFKEHVVYHWNLPRAKFSSTMDPTVFENSVKLIDKYASGKSIYILSKYDNFLPFLAKRYSAMPYPEMALSLVTHKEMQASVDLIQQERPRYLFVDTDMMRNHSGDVFKENDPVSELMRFAYDASRGRAMVLDNFAKVFARVKDEYEPVEAGQLITVYKRRSDS